MFSSQVFDCGLAIDIFEAQKNKDMLMFRLSEQICRTKSWVEMDGYERAVCVHAGIVSSISQAQLEGFLIGLGLMIGEFCIKWQTYPKSEQGVNDRMLHRMFGGPLSKNGDLVEFTLKRRTH
jgi:hypothetical protein